MSTKPRLLAEHRRPLSCTVASVLAITALIWGSDPSFADDTAAADLASSAPILVELFTSQGCSSCPPADRLLSRLAATDPSIVALAFHVDYWDHIGWKDPFSSEAWSSRQRSYATMLGSDHVYTPQIVVNGRRHGVGSDPAKVTALIAEAAADRTDTRVYLELLDSTPELLKVRLTADPSRAVRGSPWLARLAILEDDLDTPVSRGENARRKLHNDRVVRRLVAAELETSDRSAASAELTIPVDSTWKRERLHLAAFLQDPDTLWVHAAAAITNP